MSDHHSAAGLSSLKSHLSYSQCWEDPAVLVAGLRLGEGDDVLSICSAGDNSFALAIAGARSVTAIDLSAPQVALAELKLAAIRSLPPEGVYTLLGLNAPGRRVFSYHQLRGQLTAPAQAFWADNEELLRLGVLGQGKFERYLGLFRTKIMPLVHRKRTIQALLRQSDPAQQREFFDRRWNTYRWRGMLRAFFSRPVMARSGRSPAHFKYVEGAVSQLFQRRAEHVLTDIPIASNPFVQWMLSGTFPDRATLPPYLTPAGQQALRAAADRITMLHADLETFLSDCAPGSFSAFNYSNLFEYLSPAQHERILRLTVRAARPGARILYWNLLVPRSRPASMAAVLERDPERAARLLAGDRAFVYGGLQIETVR